MFQQVVRNLFSILIVVILTVTSSMAQGPMSLKRFDAQTTQKLQSLFDEDSVACCHRSYLHQEQKQLSTRKRPDKSLSRFYPLPVLANFDLVVSSLWSMKSPSKSSRAPPIQLTENV